jgi:hypothetical protein
MFGKALLPLLALACLGPLAAAGPVALFNGKDLEGWVFDVIDDKTPMEAIWSVSDGVLICKGRPPSVLRTKTEHADYELVVEWRWPGAKPGNGGVLIHASAPREMFVWPKSFEVQLRHGQAGDFWVIGETLAAPGKQEGRRWLRIAENAEKPPGEWNSLIVRCDGDKVAVLINGVPVNSGSGLSASKGAICLQSEGTEIHFRKVEITPIAGPAAAP